MTNADNAPRPENHPMIRILQAATVCFARIYHRLNVVSPCQLPRRGPAILVCNHTSALDPLLIQSVCPRLITWMMAREYYEQPGLHWIFKQIQVIPVERTGQDLSALRSALKALRQGRVLGIFPEGRLETSRELLPFQTGVALMGLKTGVPIYPSYLDGTQRGCSMLQAVLLPQHATIAFGAHIDLEGGSRSRDDLESAAKLIQSTVATLRQGVLARIVEKKENKITKDEKK